MQPDLIFDVGMHNGDDTDFYLRKGFRVVGVEALESLCSASAERFANELARGRLTLVNRAVARKNGPATFYANERLSIWGTLDPEWAARNRGHRAPSKEVRVIGVRFEELLTQHGIPYYLKVDIEGSDLMCVEALSHVSAHDRPTYVSIESTKTDWAALEREFEVFERLGYTSFKIVNQHEVEAEIPPDPPREGTFVACRFPRDSSGLFGEEAPGPWMTQAEALRAYRKIFRNYFLIGDRGILSRIGLTRSLAKRLGLRNDWYDTHARLGQR